VPSEYSYTRPLLQVCGYQVASWRATELHVAPGAQLYEHTVRGGQEDGIDDPMSVFSCAPQVMGDGLVVVPQDLSGRILLRTFRLVIRGWTLMRVFGTEFYSHFESEDHASNILRLDADLYRVKLEFCGDLLGGSADGHEILQFFVHW